MNLMKIIEDSAVYYLYKLNELMDRGELIETLERSSCRWFYNTMPDSHIVANRKLSNKRLDFVAKGPSVIEFMDQNHKVKMEPRDVLSSIKGPSPVTKKKA